MRTTATLAFLSAALLARSAIADEPRNAEAAKLYKQARALHEQSKCAEAEPLYQKSWDLVPSFDTAANLGACEIAVGQFREAAEHLLYSRDHAPTGATDAQRKTTDDRLAAARAEVATLRIRVNVEGAEVTIGQRAIGTSPIANEVFAEPGSITISATHQGYERAQKTVGVDKGKVGEVELVLAPVPASAGPAPGGEGGAWPLWPAFVGGALAATSLGFGLGFTFAANGKYDDADTRKAELDRAGTTCAGGCAELRDLRASGDSSRNAATGFFVGAGVLAVGSIGYAILRPRGEPAAAKGGGARLTPVVGRGGSGVVLSGAF